MGTSERFQQTVFGSRRFCLPSRTRSRTSIFVHMVQTTKLPRRKGPEQVHLLAMSKSSAYNTRPTQTASRLPATLCLLILVIVLFLRITRGVDITDEIQYYGEIKGLVESGRLFTTDLFFQQSVYILFYPLFWLHHQAFGYEGLIAFGRLTLAALMVLLYFFAKRRLLAVTRSDGVSSLCALALTFAVPYHGVMSPSYNTISQLMWVVYGLWFFDWHRSKSLTWTVIPVITALAHPTSSIAMAVMALVRMAQEREFRRMGKSLLAMAAMGTAALTLALQFASLEQYQASLAFSSGFGVGDVFFGSREGPQALGKIIFLFVAISAGMRWAPTSLPHWLPPLIAAGAAYALFRPFPQPFTAYGTSTVKLLSILCAAAYAWAWTMPAGGKRLASGDAPLWLMAMLLGYASTIAITSGNGLWQATGAFMVALPLLIGCAFRYTEPTLARMPHAAWVLAPLVTVCLGLVHWSAFPYREARWWQATQEVEGIPEFRYLHTTPTRAALLEQVQDEFTPLTQDRRALVITEYPGLYFAMGARIESCMVYMHSITSDTSEQRLLTCLRDKQPEVVVDVYASDQPEYVNARIKTLMREFYQQRGGECAQRTRGFPPGDAITPVTLTFRVCMPGVTNLPAPAISTVQETSD